MPQSPNTFNQVLPTQKLLRENLFNLPIHIVQKHVRHTGSLPISSHHRRGEYRRHAPRRLREVPFRRVDHHQVPLRIVHLIGKVMQREPAPLVAAKRRRRRRTRGFGAVRGEEVVGVAELSPVTNSVGSEARRVLENGLDPFRILFEE